MWLGARRVRVREADPDAFIAESAIRRGQLEAGDPWTKAMEAAKDATGAVRNQDRGALERAISSLADAARRSRPKASSGATATASGRGGSVQLWTGYSTNSNSNAALRLSSHSVVQVTGCVSVPATTNRRFSTPAGTGPVLRDEFRIHQIVVIEGKRNGVSPR